MKYSVTFCKHFNAAGEGDDYPTDFFRVPDGVIEDMTFVEMQPPDSGEFGTEIWQYEVAGDHLGSFELACERCETVLSYEALTPYPRSVNA